MKPEQPSAFHEAQRAIWIAKLKSHCTAEQEKAAVFLMRRRQIMAEHEVAMMGLREARDDAASTIEAVNLLQRIRRGE